MRGGVNEDRCRKSATGKERSRVAILGTWLRLYVTIYLNAGRCPSIWCKTILSLPSDFAKNMYAYDHAFGVHPRPTFPDFTHPPPPPPPPPPSPPHGKEDLWRAQSDTHARVQGRHGGRARSDLFAQLLPRVWSKIRQLVPFKAICITIGRGQ